MLRVLLWRKRKKSEKSGQRDGHLYKLKIQNPRQEKEGKKRDRLLRRNRCSTSIRNQILTSWLCCATTESHSLQWLSMQPIAQLDWNFFCLACQLIYCVAIACVIEALRLIKVVLESKYQHAGEQSSKFTKSWAPSRLLDSCGFAPQSGQKRR